MKKNLYGMLLCGLAMTLMVSLASCNLFPDSETEKKLAGKWECVQMQNEDGATVRITETVAYDAGNGTYRTELNADMVSPIQFHMFSVTYSGTWSATEDRLVCKIDRKTLTYTFNAAFEDSDKAEMKETMAKEIERGGMVEGGVLEDISSSSFRLRDERDNTLYRYKRID